MGNMQVFTSGGEQITLGQELGRGGEGRVFEIQETSQAVAKIYSDTVNTMKVAKLKAMVSQRTPALLSVSAWPADTLHRSPQSRVFGVLIPKIKAHLQIHTLYLPKSRQRYFPTAGWPQLIKSSISLADTVRVIHEHGHIIGDINDSNSVVLESGLVKLIDCDSFQIESDRSTYLCEVGVSSYTPPELQGVYLDDVVRTRNHDRFGLAVLIFQLIFLGRHPFAGRYFGPGEMSLERAVTEYRFAYGPDSRLRQMRPPPNTLPFGCIPPGTATLFQRAFSFDGAMADARPSPEEWITSLNDLSGALKQCRVQIEHFYYVGSSSCPFCDLERKAHNLVVRNRIQTEEREPEYFSLNFSWGQIESVEAPGYLSILTQEDEIPVLPTRQTSEQKAQCRKLKVGSLSGIVIAIPFLFATHEVIFAYCILATVYCLCLSSYHKTRLIESSMEALLESQQEYSALEKLLNSEGSSIPYDEKLEELNSARTGYEEVETQRKILLAGLEDRRAEAQLQRFLDRYLVRHSGVIGITHGDVATLESFGIETAADMTDDKIAEVSGVNAEALSQLIDWKIELETQFRFDPAKPVDLEDVKAVDHDMRLIKATYERELSAGAFILREISTSIIRRRAELTDLLRKSERTRAQTQANVDCCKQW